MKNFKSFYLILTFLSLIPHSLFSMDVCPQQLPMKDKQLALTKAIKQTLELFKQKSNLPHASKAEIFQSKGFFMQTHEGPNQAFAVFKIAHVSKLSPISDQEANKAHELLQVYDYKNKNGICSVMFRYSNKQLLPITKEQAAFLLVTPLLIDAIRTNELVSPAFLNPEQKQILSCSHPKHPDLIAVQRKELKSFLESGKLVKVFKIESGFASSTQSTQAINALNHLLHLYHGSSAEQKAGLYIKSKLQTDTVCDYALDEGFALGTIIQTDAGPKKIEAMQVGDLVPSQDLANDMQVVCPVTHIAKELIPSYIEIVLEHETIITAPGQKFYSKPLGDWITVQDIMQSPELQIHFQEPILGIRQVNESIEIYKLTIAHEHNFYITEKQLLAHNFVPVITLVPLAAPAVAGVAATVIIPAAKFAGVAIGGWIMSKFLESFICRPTTDGLSSQDKSKKSKNGKKDSDKKDKQHASGKKDKDHNHKNKQKHHNHKKKSKEKGSESKQSVGGGTKGQNGPAEQKQCNQANEKPQHMRCGNNAEPKDQNGPSKPKQCIQSGENPKHMGCGNDAGPQDQNGPSKPKQCILVDENQKHMGCGNDAGSKDQYDPDKQKQCNHSQGSQTSFGHNEDYTKDDERQDSKPGSELLPKEDIIHTEDTEKQETDNSNIEKDEKESELSDKPDNMPTQETQTKDLDVQATEQEQALAKPLQPLGIGSTGRPEAASLHEQLVLEGVIANPYIGDPIDLPNGMTDPRWHKDYGWQKMRWRNHERGIEIHYVAQYKDGIITAIDDFKFTNIPRPMFFDYQGKK